MKKTFCDICGKEIKPHIENRYNLKAEVRIPFCPTENNTYWEINFDDVCMSCMNSLKEAIKKLRR